jgi:tetratricopeptide (TPR) repeat protein
VVDAPKLALRDFELAIELDSGNGDAYNGRGVVRVGTGRYAEAARDAAEAVRLGPPSPRLLYNAARVFAQCPGADRERAAELIRQALGMLPDGERAAFWATHVKKDAAMAAVRRRPWFVQIETGLTRGN